MLAGSERPVRPRADAPGHRSPARTSGPSPPCHRVAVRLDDPAAACLASAVRTEWSWPSCAETTFAAKSANRNAAGTASKEAARTPGGGGCGLRADTPTSRLPGIAANSVTGRADGPGRAAQQRRCLRRARNNLNGSADYVNRGMPRTGPAYRAEPRPPEAPQREPCPTIRAPGRPSRSRSTARR